MRKAVWSQRADASTLASCLIDPDAIVNVIPEDDLRPHRDGSDCECCPRVLVALPNGALIVHQAWDDREDDLCLAQELGTMKMRAAMH